MPYTVSAMTHIKENETVVLVYILLLKNLLQLCGKSIKNSILISQL